MAEYQNSSPYFTTPQNRDYLGVMNNRPIPKLIDDQQYTITQTYNKRPDLLANDLYQDAGLWWVFAQRNPNTIKDPVFDFTPGTTIFIPKKDTDYRPDGDICFIIANGESRRGFDLNRLKESVPELNTIMYSSGICGEEG